VRPDVRLLGGKVQLGGLERLLAGDDVGRNRTAADPGNRPRASSACRSLRIVTVET
jgi:hypothetical protein